VREDITEGQSGIPMVVEYQVIDVATCDPIPDVYVEMWHCNSTGVYSGVVANGNGNSADTTNLDNTAFRGIQPTDDDGVAAFETKFPGHYTGRATHIHIMVHTNATLQANNTLGLDNYASHVGQAFFDQDLITAADTVEPYASNTQPVTLNTDDSIMQEEAATDGVDPIMEYTLLGDTIADGLFAWIAFGVDATQSNAISPASYYQEGGGVTNENSNFGGPGAGGAGPSGAFPSGGFPSGSGAPPSGSAAPPTSSAPTGGAAAASSSSSAAVVASSFSTSTTVASVVSSSAASPGRGNGNGNGNSGSSCGNGRKQQ
jgi:protocatechuate 3,4-dioxygenase beta subunit